MQERTNMVWALIQEGKNALSRYQEDRRRYRDAFKKIRILSAKNNADYHLSSKLMCGITCLLVLTKGNSKLLEIPKIASGSEEAMAQAIYNVIYN